MLPQNFVCFKQMCKCCQCLRVCRPNGFFGWSLWVISWGGGTYTPGKQARNRVLYSFQLQEQQRGRWSDWAVWALGSLHQEGVLSFSGGWQVGWQIQSWTWSDRWHFSSVWKDHACVLLDLWSQLYHRGAQTGVDWATWSPAWGCWAELESPGPWAVGLARTGFQLGLSTSRFLFNAPGTCGIWFPIPSSPCRVSPYWLSCSCSSLVC